MFYWNSNVFVMRKISSFIAFLNAIHRKEEMFLNKLNLKIRIIYVKTFLPPKNSVKKLKKN